MHEQIIMSPSNLSKTRRWVCLFAVLFGEFVVAIDMTVLNIALPSLTAELRPTSDQQLWIVDAYSLVLAGLLVASSSLSDRWGRKRMLLSGFAVFGIASAFILVAQTPEAIIAIRAILGVGGAMIMPATISMVRNIFTDAKERAFALAAWSSISGLGMAAGPLIGGFLLEHFSWHAAFVVNIPLMALGIVIGIIVLPEIRVKNPGSWDVAAALIALVGMVSLMWGIKHLAAVMAFDALGLAAVCAGLALMALFVVRCLRSDHPLLDVSLFRSKPFTAGIIAALGSMFAMAALLFLLAQWLQLVHGYTPLEAGIRLVPMALASIFAGMVAPAIALRIGARRTIVGGLAIVAVGMMVLVVFRNNLTYPPIMVSGCLTGFGVGSLAIASSVLQCETPPEKASSAAAFEEISYDLGNVLGVAILGSLASIIYRIGLNPAALSQAGLDETAIATAQESFGAAAEIAAQTGVTELVAEGAAAFSSSLVTTAFVGGIILLAVSFLVWRLVPTNIDITEDKHKAPVPQSHVSTPEAVGLRP